MSLYQLIFGETRYVLPEGVDIDALKDEVLAAVSAGGRYVHVENASHHAADLLVTSGVPLSFEEVPDSHPRDSSPEDGWPGRFIDWDYL